MHQGWCESIFKLQTALVSRTLEAQLTGSWLFREIGLISIAVLILAMRCECIVNRKLDVRDGARYVL